MLSSLTRNWWMAAMRGALAVIFGVIAFAWPGITFEALVLLFGAYAFVDGVLMFSFGLMAAGDHEQWWPLVLAGTLGIGLGVLTFAQPAAMGLALVYVVGFWAIVTGLLELVAAIHLREVISGEWLMGLSGVLSIIFGVLVAAQPSWARSPWCTCSVSTPSWLAPRRSASDSACAASVRTCARRCRRQCRPHRTEL